MNGASDAGPSESAAQDEFAAQARRAGLVLPTRRRLRLWEVAAITAAILLLSVAVGVATGWMNLRPNTEGPPGLFGPSACSGQPAKSVVTGTIDPESDPTVPASFSEITQQFERSYGSCVQIEYGSSGSGAGLTAIGSRSADFAVLSSAPTPSQLALLPDPVYVMPEGVASVSIVYNLPILSEPLRLNGSILAGIFSGAIVSWNDPRLAALNPGSDLPDLPISVVVRSGATPLNLALSSYLAEANRSWNSSVGTTSSPAWPVGTSVSSGTSEMESVANASGTIGYLATGTALPTGVAVSSLENPAGNFTAPVPSSVTAAAVSSSAQVNAEGGNWTGSSLVNAPGNASYPLAYFTYIVVYQDMGHAYSGSVSIVSAQWDLTFLWWAATDGGYLTESLGVNLLPAGLLAATEGTLEKVAYDGTSVLEGSEGSESGGETGEF